MSTANMSDSKSELEGANPSEATTQTGVKKWKLFGHSTSILRKWLSRFNPETSTLIYEESVDMSYKYLKVKIKSLAAEAQIIRKEEHASKARYRYLLDKQGLEEKLEKELNTFWGLRNHRTNEVRKEARAALLAYGFVRGKRFDYVERNTFVGVFDSSMNLPVIENKELLELMPRIARLATKYSDVTVGEDDVATWFKQSLVV